MEGGEALKRMGGGGKYELEALKESANLVEDGETVTDGRAINRLIHSP